MYAWSNDERIGSSLPEGLDYLNHVDSPYGEEIMVENTKIMSEIFTRVKQKTPEQIFLEKEVVENLEMELSNEARYVLHCLMWPDRRLSIFARLYSDQNPSNYVDRIGINCLRKWLVISGWKHIVFNNAIRELKQRVRKIF